MEQTPQTQKPKGLISFIRSIKHTKEELKTALSVLHTFKDCESEEEWYMGMFVTWVKLEMMEEYLEHLVENKPLKEDSAQQLRLFNSGLPPYD